MQEAVHPHGGYDPCGNCKIYVYDASGRRVRLRATTDIDDLYDLAGNVITELTPSGAVNRNEVYAGGVHIATYSGGTTYFTHSDWLGTERVRSTVAGGVYSTWSSYPFGEGSSASNPGPTHFTGKDRDAESGNDYFGARYYNPTLGRFMNPDWSSTPEPVPYADLGNPQSLNLYGYVLNNPLGKFDVDGHVVVDGIDLTNFTPDTGHTEFDWAFEAQQKAAAAAKTAQQQSNAIAQAATSQYASTSYEYGRSNKDFPAGTNKCNEFVADTIAASGAAKPQVPRSGILGWLGFTRDPTAKEWATMAIPGWSAPDSVANARVGDVIAVGHHDDNEGHVGIVVAPGYATASVSARTSPAGVVVVNGWGFRPAGQNEEHSGDSVVVRHYIGSPQ
jgi:RHS repeat-associated protein